VGVVTRTCENCNATHTYTIRKKKKYDVGFYCTNCRKAEQKAIRKRHPEVMQERDLIKDFGLTLAQYNQMLVAQNGVCAICKKPETAIRDGELLALAVDHNHKTNQIRALLCGNCNKGIGNLQESPELLITAAQYLKSFE